MALIPCAAEIGAMYLSGAHHARRVTAIRQEFRGPQA
jgi:hypothetical protein